MRETTAAIELNYSGIEFPRSQSSKATISASIFPAIQYFTIEAKKNAGNRINCAAGNHFHGGERTSWKSGRCFGAAASFMQTTKGVSLDPMRMFEFQQMHCRKCIHVPVRRVRT